MIEAPSKTECWSAFWGVIARINAEEDRKPVPQAA